MSSYRKTMSEALREVDEMKLRFAEAKYELYHKDFSSAMQHAYHVAKKHHGITVDPKEIDDKVASGPKKPSEGKTNSYRLKGDKGAVQIQVYNKGGSKPFELNMYKEEVDLDEGFKTGDKVKIDTEFEGETHNGQSGVIHKVGTGRNKGAYTVKFSDGKVQSYDDEELIKEEVDLDEASKEGTIKIIKTKDGKFQIQKMTKGKFVDIGKPYNSAKEAEKFRSGQSNLFGEEVDLDEASARADAMKAMHKGKSVDPADVDTFASDDDVKAASKNIIMQLRKSVSLRGDMEVEFGDKKKVKVSSKIAQAVQNKFNKLRRPADKEKFQMQISKSYKDLLKAIKEETIKESKFGIINKQLKGEK